MKKGNEILKRLLSDTSQEIEHFLNQYSQQTLMGDASLFLGSGVSRNSGFPSWAKILQPCANELGVTIDTDTDLYSIAQYYANRNSDSELRKLFNHTMNKNYTDNVLLDKLLEIPFNSVWTTNYDKLIEHSFDKTHTGYNVITSDTDLPNISKGIRKNVFKMNGDYSNPTSMIITDM